SSITTVELAQVVEGLRFIETMLANPVDKDAMAGELQEMRALFTRSLVAAHDLARGSELTRADVAFKKPGTGLPPSRLGALIGRSLRRAVPKDAVIAESDLA